jgi:hypothetical protein
MDIVFLVGGELHEYCIQRLDLIRNTSKTPNNSSNTLADKLPIQDWKLNTQSP